MILRTFLKSIPFTFFRQKSDFNKEQKEEKKSTMILKQILSLVKFYLKHIFRLNYYPSTPDSKLEGPFLIRLPDFFPPKNKNDLNEEKKLSKSFKAYFQD